MPKRAGSPRTQADIPGGGGRAWALSKHSSASSLRAMPSMRLALGHTAHTTRQSHHAYVSSDVLCLAHIQAGHTKPADDTNIWCAGRNTADNTSTLIYACHNGSPIPFCKKVHEICVCVWSKHAQCRCRQTDRHRRLTLLVKHGSPELVIARHVQKTEQIRLQRAMIVYRKASRSNSCVCVTALHRDECLDSFERNGSLLGILPFRKVHG